MVQIIQRLGSFFEKVFFDPSWAKRRRWGVFLFLGLYIYYIGSAREMDAIQATIVKWESIRVIELFLKFLPELKPLLHFLAIFLTPESFRYVFAPLFSIIGFLIWGAAYVQDIYELRDFRSGWRYVNASLFGISYPVLTIADGKMMIRPDEENLLERIGGPGRVVIHPGNAVLFESLRQPTNVRGEGTHFIPQHERVKEVFDLEDHQGHLDSLSAVTKDGVVVIARDVNYRYRLSWMDVQGAKTPAR